MFRKAKLKRKYITAISMALVLLFVNTLGLLINTRVSQISPPATSTWANYVAAPSIGDGTSDSPYIISSAEELAYVAANTTFSNVELQNDIDLAGHEWVSMIVMSFNGNGHTIKNMKMNMSENNVGFIGGTGAMGVIKNVNFSNVNLFGKTAASVFAGSLMGTIQNVTVHSGRVVAKGNAAGIVVGHGMGTINNCINNAEVISLEGSAGGIVGFLNSTMQNINISNSINTGNITARYNAGGIAGTFTNAQIKDCFSEGNITGSTAGGVCGSGTGTIENCGFKGNIKLQGESALLGAGSIIGGFGDVWTYTPLLNIVNSFGVADIDIGNNDFSSVARYGVGTTLRYSNVSISSYTPSFTSSYSYSNVVSTSGIKEYRQYKINTTETEPFSEMAYYKNINGGYPFPKSLFAVGQFIDNDVMGYLQNYGFDRFTLPVKEINGKHYVELGWYPQSYVGNAMNAELKNWYAENAPTRIQSFHNELGTSAEHINQYTYDYNGVEYARVISAIVHESGYTFVDGTTIVSGNEYWFKVEPIKWEILNYDEVLNGNPAIVLSRQGLTSNICWNKSQSEQNLWSSKSNIRTYLNNNFYGNTFRGVSDEYIKITSVPNNSQSSNDDGTGRGTQDKVWLLSYNEANGKYMDASLTTNFCSPTDYALVNNCYMYTSSSTELRPNGGCSPWWLRSAYVSSSNAAAQCVTELGTFSNYFVYREYVALRPAMTLAL